MSYWVRCRSRWASSSLPSASSSAQRSLELGADRCDGALDLPLGGRCSASPARSRRARIVGDDSPVSGSNSAGARPRRRTARPGRRSPRRPGKISSVSPLDAEGAAGEHGVVAGVLDRDELAQQLVAIDTSRRGCSSCMLLVVDLRRAEAVDAGDRGDDDHVAAREQRRRRGVAEAVDLVVDRGVLLDVEVAARDVGLRLVVVVVGDEVLDRVVAGSRSRNSLHSCAASVLLCAITSAGRWTAWIVAAIVIVLPVPVAPSSVVKRSPASMPAASCSIAARLVGGGREGGIQAEVGHRFQYRRSRCCARGARGGAPRGNDSSSLQAVLLRVGALRPLDALNVGARLREPDR